MKKIIPLLSVLLLILISISCKDDDVKDTPKTNTELLDSDNDGVIDSEDSDPKNPNKCKDSDNDGCDDCSITGADKSGGDPNNDGPDKDNDGICDSGEENKDTDNDGVIDSEDSDPKDPNKCKDSDNDGCDDCSVTGADKSGGDPNNDGPDKDNDGICDSGEENKDTDNDGVLDSEDNDPNNPNSCKDSDNDGCDDCRITGADKSGGDPNNDGEDLDKDGICDENDSDITVYLSGNKDSDITLNPNVSYILNGTYRITNNATLTIPAGTIITSKKGIDNYIAILMGSKINIQGTKEKPVIIKGQQGESGEWGGIVICGKALSTKGTDTQAEIGGLKYGGTDTNDNSGSINYLIIKNSGANINAQTQFNGLSLYAVGSGTFISNVAIFDGGDDAIELFGGSVSIKNLYAENNEDDSIDWTEGWNGTIENAYVKLNTQFDSAVEGDGTSTKPLIKNLTAVSSIGGQAIIMKNSSAAEFIKLTLTNFDSDKSFVSRNDGIISESTVDGSDAIANGVYNTSTTGEIDFSWVK